MKVLITGANGFVGTNLQAELLNKKYSGVIEPLYFGCETYINITGNLKSYTNDDIWYK